MSQIKYIVPKKCSLIYFYYLFFQIPWKYIKIYNTSYCFWGDSFKSSKRSLEREASNTKNFGWEEGGVYFQKEPSVFHIFSLCFFPLLNSIFWWAWQNSVPLYYCVQAFENDSSSIQLHKQCALIGTFTKFCWLSIILFADLWILLFIWRYGDRFFWPYLNQSIVDLWFTPLIKFS